MPVRIRARYEGFRRCGVTHHLEPTVHADDRFTDEEMKVLEAEPMLTVERVLEESVPVDPERMTVAQLREELPDAPPDALKADLVKLYRERFSDESGQSD